MKTKQLALSVVATLLGIVASIFGFLNMFDYKTVTTLGSNVTKTLAETPWSIFGGTVNEVFTTSLKTAQEPYNNTFRTISMILVIVLMIVVVAYALLIVLDMKKGKKFEALRKILSFALMVCGVLLAISLIVYVTTNSATLVATTHSIYCSSVFGAIALTVFPVLAGVCGYVAECGSKKKKK